MSCTPFVYIASDGASNIDTDENFPLGTVVHQVCEICRLVGDGVVCSGRHAYDVEVLLTVSQVDTSSSTPPLLEVELCQNGSRVRGAYAAANSSGTVTLSLSAIVRSNGQTSSVLTVKNLGPIVNLKNLSMKVKPVII